MVTDDRNITDQSPACTVCLDGLEPKLTGHESVESVLHTFRVIKVSDLFDTHSESSKYRICLTHIPSHPSIESV